jgi:hypothetical protein
MVELALKFDDFKLKKLIRSIQKKKNDSISLQRDRFHIRILTTYCILYIQSTTVKGDLKNDKSGALVMRKKQ